MRSRNIIKNVKVNFIFFFITMFFNFISRTIFIQCLGTNITGYNTLVQNLLSFLNIVELGVGTAISYALYKPLNNKNIKKINEIMILLRYYYYRIGILIFIFGIGISFLLKFLIKDQIPLTNGLVYYYMFLVNSVISYFLIYKQTLIIADQKQYVVTIINNISKIIKTIFQIIALLIYKNYFLWILLEVGFNIISLILNNIKIKKTYPVINLKSEKSITLIKNENKSILKMIKDVFFHKVSTFIVYQTDGILISTFSTLTQTAIYSNYMMIINNITKLVDSVLGAMAPSIGNLIAENEDSKSLETFKKLYLLDNIIATYLCCVIYYVIDSFISIWVGADLKFSNNIIILLLINLYIQISRGSIIRFKQGYGLFWDIWAPVIEGGINLGFSIMLANKIGISGIFIGTLISNIVIVLIWQPYMLYKYGFKTDVLKFFRYYITIIVRGVIGIIISDFIINYMNSIINFKESFSGVVLLGCMVSIILLFTIFIVFIFTRDFRELVKYIFTRFKGSRRYA